MSSAIFAAIVGTKHYFGADFLKPGMLVHLRKDASNVYDEEAIRVELTPIGKIGYIANSPHTVPSGCRSSGRIYDVFDDHICAFVRFVVRDIAIIELAPGLEEVHLIKWSNDETIRLP